MPALPYMPLYVADYLADAAHLTTIGHGAYLLLIMTYWQRGEPLPDDERKLARIARMSDAEWNEVRDDLREFFDISDGEWRHARIEHELEKVRAKSKASSEAGKASAQRRLNKRSTPVERPFNHTDTDTDTDKNRSPKGDSPSENPKTESNDPDPQEVEPLHDVDEALSLWNKLAAHRDLPKAQKLTPGRRSKLRQRLRDCGGIEGFKNVLRAAARQPFLMGDNQRGWRLSLDSLLQASTFVKIQEGTYGTDDQKKPDGSAQRSRGSARAVATGVARAFGISDERQGAVDSESDDPKIIDAVAQGTIVH